MAASKKIQTITDVVAALDKAQTIIETSVANLEEARTAALKKAQAMHKAILRQSVDAYPLLYQCKRFIEAHPELCEPPLRDRYTRLATRLQEEVFEVELDEDGG